MQVKIFSLNAEIIVTIHDEYNPFCLKPNQSQLFIDDLLISFKDSKNGINDGFIYTNRDMPNAYLEYHFGKTIAILSIDSVCSFEFDVWDYIRHNQ